MVTSDNLLDPEDVGESGIEYLEEGNKKINFCFTGMELWYLGGELRFQISGFTWTFPGKENVKEI